MRFSGVVLAIVAVPFAVGAGCGSVDADAGPFEPASGSVSGYYPVVIRSSVLGVDPAIVTGVTFGGIKAYGLVATAGGDLQVTVQGHPDGGKVAVDVATPGGVTRIADSFTYIAPPDPRLARMMGFGASLSQGIQRTVPSEHGTLHGPIALIARQMGAYLPLPVPVPALFPEEGMEILDVLFAPLFSPGGVDMEE